MFRLQHLLERDFEDARGASSSSENGKSLEEARGEVRRGIDVVEFAAGMPTLMLGGALEQVSRGVDTELFRHPIGVVAGDHAVQLPGDGAAVDGADSGRLRQRVHPQALAADAACRDAACRALRGSGRAAGRVQRRPRRRGSGERDLRPRAHPRRLVRRLGPGREAPSTRVRPQRRASGSRRSPARRTTSSSCRMPTSMPPCRACSPPPSRTRASAASRVRSALRSARSATSCPSASPAMAREARIGPGLDPESTITPVTTEQARERIAGYIALGEQEGARILVDGRRRGRRRLLPRPHDPRRVRPEMRVAQEEIFGPVLALERLDSLDEALDGDRAERVRQRERDLHPQRRRRTCLPSQGHGRNGRDKRPRAGLDGVLSPSRAGRARSTGISTRRAWTACVSSPRPRSSRARW